MNDNNNKKKRTEQYAYAKFHKKSDLKVTKPHLYNF